jgi:xanthine dehydrogenase accessory factor
MRDVMHEVREWFNSGEVIALATVIETWGSSPRPVGSRLAVTASGKMAGSVSNGCIEGAVFEEAQKVLKEKRPRLVAFGVADEDAFEVGLACGGHIEVYIQPFTTIHEGALRYLEQERSTVLRTNLKTGETELLLTDDHNELPRREGDWFVEPLLRPPHMVIVGAIHIAVPLHRLAKLMGYRVTVVDARSQFATDERFPEADEILHLWPDEALNGIRLDASTFVVILTHDPKFDLPALRVALGSQARYIGAIGSRKTNGNRMEQLRAEGFTKEQLGRVHGPIGLDLGGRGADDTALAILAEITAVRNGGSGGSMSRPAEKAKPAAAPRRGAARRPRVGPKVPDQGQDEIPIQGGWKIVR